jgi:putative flippase GtrA
VTSSYVINSFSVESGGRLTLREYMTFAASQVGGLVANATAVILVSSALTVPIAKLLALVVGFAVNFSVSHLVVFRRGRSLGVG